MVGKTLIVTILIKNASFRSYGTFAYLLNAHIRNMNMCMYITKVHSRSVDPQKNCRNYLITHSIFKFPMPCRSSLQCRSFDIYISTVGPKNKKLAVLP